MVDPGHKDSKQVFKAWHSPLVQYWISSSVLDFHLPNNNLKKKKKLKETIKENKQAVENSSIILHGYLSICTYTSSTSNSKFEQGEQETHAALYED